MSAGHESSPRHRRLRRLQVRWCHSHYRNWDAQLWEDRLFPCIPLYLLRHGLLPRTSYINSIDNPYSDTETSQLRSLRSLILPDAATTAAPVNTSHRSRRITFLFLVAVSQIVYMGLLVRV